MTRCDTHALVGSVTNQGVLAFRCFPSNHSSQTPACPWRNVQIVATERHPDTFMEESARLNCCSSGASLLYYSEQTQKKWPVSFGAQREQEQVRALHETGRQTSERHMRRARDVLFCPCCGSRLLTTSTLCYCCCCCSSGPLTDLLQPPIPV